MSGPGNVSMDAARGKKSSGPLMMKSILLKSDGGDNSIIVEVPSELVARRLVEAVLNVQTTDTKTGKPAPFDVHTGHMRAMVLDVVTDELVAAGEKASTMFDLKMKPSEFRKAQIRATVDTPQNPFQSRPGCRGPRVALSAFQKRKFDYFFLDTR